ncbi:helix-turn-helix domain-containing protein [Streptomyces sp. LHD-70]|uniref:TetR/AcrR family transcriptional regulator n=1 Tax=Streptomyces sp. LHD-70 TaxID=3072140 RepID=UPI00280FCCE3|nr:helix-turn-helix domain-containing protein [Streptomyces sp. LHD-70]MDQ8708122.1 helix-turn-helix domain-containing protein [Streptomyces sp. LHD-70]
MTDSKAAQPPSRLRRGREGVLAAATVLFQERGYDATSMADVARRAGVTKAAVYRHVRSKPDLLRAVTEPVRAALCSLLSTSAVTDGRGLEGVAGLLRALTDRAVADPAGHALLWGTASLQGEHDGGAECQEAVLRRLVELLERAVAEGDVRSNIEPRLVARLLLGAIVSTNCPSQELGSPPHAAVDALLSGLARSGNVPGEEAVRRWTRAA